MKCNVCGHEDDRDFEICPYCGEDLSADDNDVIFGNYNNSDIITEEKFFEQNNLYAENEEPAFKQELIYAENYIPKDDVSTPNTPVVRDLPMKEPKNFFRASNGFVITRRIDNGDFFHKYILILILSFIFFILTNGHADVFTTIFNFFMFMLGGNFLNSIYNKILNKFTFEVTKEGISIQSPLMQYFVERSNIRQFWFSKKTTTKSNNFLVDLLYLLSSKAVMVSSCRGGASIGGFEVADSKVFDLSTHKTLFNVFFEVNDPIFKYQRFTSRDKKAKRFINTGLAFKDPAHARFMEREFERVLGIKDELIEEEFDYDTKVRKIVNEKLKGIR